MTTFAHIAPNTNIVLDPALNDTVVSYKSRFGSLPNTDWASHTFKQVTDGTVHGAIDNGDGSYTNPTLPAKGPVNANNPYFGKKKLTGSQFLGLCISTIGITAFTRVSTAKSFDGVKTWVLSEGVIIDVDDKNGQFLTLAGVPKADGFLTTALADDGQPLLTQAQRDAIMTAWN